MSDSPSPEPEADKPVGIDPEPNPDVEPGPESADLAAAEDLEGEPKRVSDEGAETGEPRSGGWRDIEDGVGHLFAAFERGVLNIADAEGQRRASTKTGNTNIADSPPSDGSAVSTEGAGDQAEAGGGIGVEADPAPEVAQREPRPGSTYAEALAPIRWKRVLVGAVAVAVLAALYWGATYLQVSGAADDIDGGAADAIVVLGAAQFDGTPSPALAARLDRALELWHDDRAELIMTTGSNREGDRFTEGFSGFVYLREAGVPEAAILTIVDGVDTYEQMTAAQAQLDDRDLASVLLVSDGYHSYRLRAIADEIGLDAKVAPTSIAATTDDLIRETTAVAIGRLIGYRRLSAWG